MSEFLPEVLANTQITVAFGSRREDMAWMNHATTFGKLINKLTTFRKGPKNGACLTQGALVSGRRLAKNVICNYILMVDCDTGESLDEIQAKIETAGLCAYIWTTYSHLKPVSTVAESKYLAWVRKHHRGDETAEDPIENLDAIRAYLRSTGRVKESILESIFKVERILADGGVQYVVHHDPMPRARALFLLKEPFDFLKGGSQDARIQEWKDRYANFSDSLGLAYDRSCVDPSRLMYMPAMSPDADESIHELRWIDGDPLDLNAIGPPSNNDADLDAFRTGHAASAHSGKLELKTPGLAKFLKRYPIFNAAEFLRTVAPDDIRSDQDGKVECCCPNDDAHSNAGDPTDRAFFATDAELNDGVWVMHCQHDSCIAAASEHNHDGRPDRAWFLDLACQKYGIAHADELIQFTDGAGGAEDNSQDVQEMPENQGFLALQSSISMLANDASPAEIDDVIRRISESRESPIAIERLLQALADRTGVTISVLRTTLKSLQRSRATAVESIGADNVLFTRHEPPSDDEIGRQRVTTIYSYWDHKEQLRVARKAFAVANKRDPTIFVKPEGGQVRVRRIEDKLVLEDCGDSKAMWTAELNNFLTFKRVTDEGEETVPPWDSIVTEFAGSNRIELPVCRGVSNIPIFAADGELITARGYNPKTKIYLWPDEDYLPVPKEPTQEDVAAAMNLLLEPLRDFPFTDVFDGSVDPLPIRDGSVDADGFPLPNWSRGYVSRLHTIALILQPFMREMIQGPCPIYHVDKSAPGTGAGYLIDITQIILTGDVADSGTYNPNKEEFRKEIFASLRRGTPSLIYDNINDHVDDPVLAQSLTSGKLRGRILGQSTEMSVPIRSTWIFAGNNLSFSGEMTRRICPIRMDANLPDPSIDRPSSYYKYQDVRTWVREHRLSLVRACHVLIAYWVACGRPQVLEHTLASFEAWSRCMAGLLDCAGYPGFMETFRDYFGARNEEKASASVFVEKLWEKFADKPFTTTDAYEVGCDGGSSGGLSAFMKEPAWAIEEIPVSGRDAQGCVRSLGRYIKKQMVGKTYRVAGEMMVKFTTRKQGNNPFHVLQPM